ncbi:E3 ubiquitin-protein ligase SIAH1 isoform X1 [Terrapene carolina triunguis]|uniref:E3 ubiquitin-protein ligase SIAH1 isoform X1 n=1 Tax=Terrapene triunguis TaxID=2587831 RepID=UPI000CEF6A8C|nr:E3 ubiquitin-protein ligase SIAH1 isoform X1 [Terrapene carolina triunguis]
MRSLASSRRLAGPMRSRRAGCACAEAATGCAPPPPASGTGSARRWRTVHRGRRAPVRGGVSSAGGGREGRSERLVCRAGPQPCRREPRSESPRSRDEMSRQTATALPTGTSKCTPSQRVPALTGTTASNNDLASLFECPVCFDYVLPPILQCQSGHLVCSNCRPKLTCCPTCRGPLGSIRNLAMEKVANSVLFPCKYASSGCEITLPHTEKADHEELCEFRPYSCPCPGASCKWQGSLDAVMPHLMHQHKSITTLQGEDIVFLATDINLPGAVDWVMMQSCFGFHFMLVLEKQEKYDGHQQFFAIVQLIGTRKQAENFAYRLELNGHRRRLTWEATPRSIHEGIATAIMNSDCLVFDTSIAQLFAENGNLGINVTISMC